MRLFHNHNAVSEVVGEILLLAIAVASVSVLYMQLTSVQGPQDTAYVTIVGKIERGAPVFEMQRGESLASNTQIIITTAGFDRQVYTLDQYLQTLSANQQWDIGERIALPSEEAPGMQVDATIIDTHTNAVVFWGVLQEGMILPSHGKGGIWHFDEQGWHGIPNEVKDSSGNNNHGIAKNGAKIINGTTQPYNVTHLNAGYFDGINDYVKVNTSWTLNITNTITLEAWMKPRDPQSVIDIIELEEKFGYTPYIIPLHDTYYALVSEDQAKGGVLATVEITPEGNITYLHFAYFGNSTSQKNLRPMITKMSEWIILVSFIDENLYLHMKTYNISLNGTITYTGNELVITDYHSTNNVANRPSLVRITDNMVAFAYWVDINHPHPRVGNLKTLRIGSHGEITFTGKMIEYDSSVGYEPCLIHVSGTLYALAYRGPSDHGILKTFTITSLGNITYTGKTLEFETGKAYEPCLIRLSDSSVAIAYRNYENHNDYGTIKTFTILTNGSIVWTTQSLRFERIVGCFDPCIIHYTNDVYIIAYATGRSGSTSGYVITLRIADNGSIAGVIDSRKEFDSTRCYNPIILHLSDNLFAIAYEGFGDHPGKLITLLIGEETFPPYRGIYKKDSYSIYANLSTVIVSINNVMVSHPITLGWHHFAVTYNGTTIALYIDGVLENSTQYVGHQIIKTSAPLYFGRHYCGFIDEIALFDNVLTQEEIHNHYQNPGVFE